MFNTHNLTNMSQILMWVRITLGCDLKSRILGIIPYFLYLLYLCLLYLGEVEGICPCPKFAHRRYTFQMQNSINLHMNYPRSRYRTYPLYPENSLVLFFWLVLSTSTHPLFQVTTVWISVTVGDTDILMQIVSQSCYVKQYRMYFSGLNSVFILDNGVPRNTLSYRPVIF